MKEPMITGEMKVWYVLGGVLVAMAVVYGWVSGGVEWSRIGSNPGQLVGALSVGYKGPVGEHTGYGVLLGSGVVGLLLGTAMGFARRDRDQSTVEREQEQEQAEAQASIAGVPAGPPSLAARVPWPLLVSLGLALVSMGLALDRFVAILGLGLVVAAGVGWWDTSGSRGGGAPRATAVDPLVAWIRSSARGPLAVRAVALVFVLFGVYVLFASFATRSGMALLGIVLLGGAVLLASWVEVQLGERRQPDQPAAES